MTEEWRALLVSDLHLSNNLPHAKPTEQGRTDRLEDQIRLFDHISKTAKSWDVDATFILGDLFDKAVVDAVTWTETARCLSQHPAPLFVLGGNHEGVSVHGERFTTDALGAIEREGLSVIGDGPVSPVPWLRFWPFPYSSSDTARQGIEDASAEIKKDRRTHEVGLLHHSVLGCAHEGWICNDGLTPEEACGSFSKCFSGHFHTPQPFGSVGQYLGSPLQFRFDDEGRKAGFWIARFLRDGSEKLKFISSKLPKFWRREYGERLPSRVKPGDYLRITFSGTHAEWLSRRPELRSYVKTLQNDGVRATLKHDPTYHHAARIKGSGGSSGLRLEDMMEAYVRSPDVDTEGLDVDRLVRMGREALGFARRETES